MQRATGFTLLELLVSISIFSVLGLGAYQMLQTVVDSHERVRSGVDTYTQMNLALNTIQRDFNQFSPRPIRDEYGEPLAPMVFENPDYIIEFTRGGWRNPAGRPRSRLQRVAYRLDYDNETLIRDFWEVLDRAEDSEPRSQILMTGVTDFQVTGFAGESEEDTGFELDERDRAAPLAVEVTLSTEALGDTQRLFQLVEPFVNTGAPINGSNTQQDEAGETNQVDSGSANDGSN